MDQHIDPTGLEACVCLLSDSNDDGVSYAHDDTDEQLDRFVGEGGICTLDDP